MIKKINIYILCLSIGSIFSEKCVVDFRECRCRFGSSIGTGRPGQTLCCFVADDRCRGKCLNCKFHACRPNDPLINSVKVGCAPIY